MSDVGVEFAVLHGEERIGSLGLDSDLDLAVGSKPRAIAQKVSGAFSARGLVTALVWPYDIGGSASLFVSTADGSAGAQIDMLYDPEGRGRYGVRSQVLLERRRQGIRYPIPASLDQDLYLLRKSRAKGQAERVARILSSFEERSRASAARERAQQLFSPQVAAEVVNELDRGRRRRAVRPLRRVGNLARLVGRIRRPIGYWVELIGADQEPVDAAADLDKRLGAWLVKVDSGSRPAGRFANFGWWLRVVTPVRLRPAVFISSSIGPQRRPAPDLTLFVGADADVTDLAKRIVAGMASRVPR